MMAAQVSDEGISVGSCALSCSDSVVKRNGEGRGSCRSRGSSTGSTTLTDDSGVFDKSPPPARVQKKRLVCDIPLTTPPNTGRNGHIKTRLSAGSILTADMDTSDADSVASRSQSRKTRLPILGADLQRAAAGRTDDDLHTPLEIGTPIMETPSSDLDSTLAALVRSVSQSHRSSRSRSVDLSGALGISEGVSRPPSAAESEACAQVDMEMRSQEELARMGAEDIAGHLEYLQAKLDVINAELKELLSEHDAQAVQREHLDEKLVGVLTHLNEDYEVANYLLQRKALTEEGAALQGGVPARQEKKRKSWFR